MNNRRDYSARSTSRQARRRNTSVSASTWQRQPKQARRSISGQRSVQLPFAPPEDWHEVTDREQYRVVTQPAGDGFRLCEIAPGVTLDEVRASVGCTLTVPGDLTVIASVAKQSP